MLLGNTDTNFADFGGPSVEIVSPNVDVTVAENHNVTENLSMGALINVAVAVQKFKGSRSTEFHPSNLPEHLKDGNEHLEEPEAPKFRKTGFVDAEDIRYFVKQHQRLHLC